jgi:hypothetical protein
MADKKRINGNLYSKASATIKIEGEAFEGWATLEYGDKMEAPFAWGAAKHAGPRGTTEGRYTPDNVVIGWHVDTAKDVRAKLAGLAPDGSSIGKPSVTIILTLDETALGVTIVEFESCRLREIGNSVEDSAEATLEKHTYQPLRVKRDGQTLYDQSVAGA